jgi:bifunctional DNA-binding transcriptional regulator/antitoxin component of YhaV-PrlF toxin-antitoxin module
MALVTVNTKYQLTLPPSVRKQARVAVGDLLEARVEGKKITLTPKSVIDHELRLALQDVKKGRVSPTFTTAAEGIHWLNAKAKKSKKRAKKMA